MTNLKNNILKYWFFISTLLMAVLVFLLDSQGKKISDLHLQIQQNKLGEQLKALQDRSEKSQENYEKSQNDYRDLVSRHGDLLNKLGITLGPDVGQKPSKTDTQ